MTTLELGEEVNFWRAEAKKFEELCERFLNDPPAQMSTPLGMLPINAEGMRELVDALAKAQHELYIATKLACES